MQLCFLVNDVEHIEAKQTTAMLIAEAARQGFDVLVFGVRDLYCSSEGIPMAWARSISSTSTSSLGRLVQEIAHSKAKPVQLTRADALIIRTNPARDKEHQWAHAFALQLASSCKERGVFVVNDPSGLRKASSKLYLLEMPESVRPRTLISQQNKDIVAFIEDLEGPAVLKPLEGTRGNDVFFVSSGEDKNLNQIIDVILRQSAVMVQEFVPGAKKGDTRVVLLNGEILRISDKTAAIWRVPGEGELRSNIHTGGTAKQGIITETMENVVSQIGPKLVRDGLFLVGLDFIGDKIIEINVFSTGGFRDAERFHGVSFSEKVINHIVAARESGITP